MSSEPEEHSPLERTDRWVLPVGEGLVTQLLVDFAFGFTLDSRVHFRIEGSFRFGRDDDAAEYEPVNSAALGPLLALHQATVLRAEVSRTGDWRWSSQTATR